MPVKHVRQMQPIGRISKQAEWHSYAPFCKMPPCIGMPLHLPIHQPHQVPIFAEHVFEGATKHAEDTLRAMTRHPAAAFVVMIASCAMTSHPECWVATGNGQFQTDAVLMQAGMFRTAWWTPILTCHNSRTSQQAAWRSLHPCQGFWIDRNLVDQ